MKTIQAGPNKIVIYDSINNLPPHRESMMNFYALSEAGIGHDFESIERHLSAVKMAAYQGDMQKLMQEAENLTLSYVTIASQYNPEHLSWLCLIAEINDEPFTDLSEDNLSQTAKRLSEEGGMDYNWREIFDIVKKKFPENWLSTFQDGQLEQVII